jgi:hypothetical protein
MEPETTLPPTPASPKNSPNANAGGPLDWSPIPEEVRDEWRWIFQGWEAGLFKAYAGKYIAIFQHTVWESSCDRELLLKYVALKHNLDPGRVVVTYIDRAGSGVTPPASHPAVAPAANPTPQPADDSETPQDIIEWRWIYKGRREGWLAEYLGKHIAVDHEKVIASHESLARLHDILRNDLHLDPAYVVTALID